MTGAIHTLHWDEIGSGDPSWTHGDGRLFAVWPAPFEHDACMKAAGFTDFADCEEGWHAEFESVCSRVLGALETYGAPIVRQGEFPERVPGVLERIRGVLTGRSRAAKPEPTLTDMVVATAASDDFTPCIIDFGAPSRAAMRIADGHCIFWIHVTDPGASLDELLAAAAQNRTVQRSALDWKAMLHHHDPDEDNDG